MKSSIVLGSFLSFATFATALAADSAQDANFVQQASIGGMAEVQAGQVAVAQATMPSVKQFGRTMVMQHSKNNQQLMTLAKSRGLSVPSDLDGAHKAEAVALKNTTGTNFDSAYITNQIAGHKAMAQVMKNEIQSGTDPELKSFAEKTLPVVQDHLKMAEALQLKTAP